MRPKLIISPRFCKLISIFINVGAITLYPFIIARKPLGITTHNHESIHIVQQRELYIIGFYILWASERWEFQLQGFCQKASLQLIF